MPLTDSYGQNVPYPTLTDKPNAQSLGQGIVEGIVPKSVMTFASAVVRGATIAKPVAGMVTWLKDRAVLEVYDGTAWTTVASGSSTWKGISLNSGFTTNGNANGIPQYRIVNMFGERTIMFRGGVDLTNGYDSNGIKNGGIINRLALPADATPSSRRTLVVACSVARSDSASLKIDVNTNGFIGLVGTNKSDIKPPWISLNGLFTSL